MENALWRTDVNPYELRMIPTRGLNTRFQYSLRNPASLVEADGFNPASEKGVSVLLTKLSVETEYRNMDAYAKMKYFPVYMTARLCFRIPQTGDEFLRIPCDCLRKYEGGLYMRLAKRIRKQESEPKKTKGKRKEPEYEEGLYRYYWYPVSKDVADAVLEYAGLVKLPESAFLFDYSLPSDSDEKSLKMLASRMNEYLDEYVKGSALEKTVLNSYGVQETNRFSTDKRRLFNEVLQVSRANAFSANADTENVGNLNEWVYGPTLAVVPDEEALLVTADGNKEEDVPRIRRFVVKTNLLKEKGEDAG